MKAHNSTLGVAVVGMGVGAEHARAYANIEPCDLLWLCDLEREKALRVSQSLGAGKVCVNFEELLHDRNVHLISIASYDDAHFEQARRALASGKHVFVEKPMCRSTEELRALKREWRSHNGTIKLCSNLVLRAAPLYQWLKQTLEAEDMGNVYAFDGDYLFGRIHKITAGWRKNVDDYSVMQGGGIHLIDLFCWLTRERPVTVFANGNRISTRGTPFRYNDFVSLQFETPSGLVGRITANFGSVHPHQHALRVFGTKATFLYDDAGPRLHTTRDPAISASRINLSPFPQTKGDLIPGFVSAISENRDLNDMTQSMFDSISIAVACDQALRTKSTVEVEYV